MQHKLNKAINALHRKSLANGLEYGAEEAGAGGSRSPWQSLPRTDSPAPMKGEIVMLSRRYVSYMIPLVGWCASPEEAARRQVAAAAVFNVSSPAYHQAQFIFPSYYLGLSNARWTLASNEWAVQPEP